MTDPQNDPAPRNDPAPVLLTTAEERQEFRLSVRRLLAERSTESDTRRLADDPVGYDPALWKQLAAELGLPGLLVPEEHGGQGLTLVEVAVALEEAGRTLLAGPLLSSGVLAPTAVLAAGDQAAAARLLPGIADGSLLVAVSLEGGVTATRSGDGWSLQGVARDVVDGQLADRLLVVADVSGELGLFEVAVRSSGAVVASRRTIDHTTRLAAVTLEATPAVRLGGAFDAGRVHVLDVAAVATAAELVGVAEAALRIAVDYAKTREQFGRVIGSYQGVKHLCAGMYARQQLSRATVGAAAAASVTAPATLHEKASVAKAYTATSAVQVVEDCIQVLGGIGFTWEHGAHLYLRRAKVLELLFGDARAHRAALAGQLGLLA